MHGTPRLIVEIIIRVVVLGVAFCLVWFGYINYLRGFGSFRHAVDDADRLALCHHSRRGVLIALFTIEQLVNGLRNGFDHPEPPEEDLPIVPSARAVQTRVGQ